MQSESSIKINHIFNEKLHFSWGHIISCMALIAIAYCTFVGSVYLTGYFILSGIITLIIVVLMGMLFFIPQQLKGTTHRFEKRIKWERAFIFSSPVLFLLMMIPFSHSWTVYHRQNKILENFNSVMKSANDMFVQYEQYSTKRMADYSSQLSDAGQTRENKEAMLKLVLLSSNYDTLKHASNAWMKIASNPKVSTWNIFLLGNIGEIKEAIHYWHQSMQDFSKKALSDEKNPQGFDESGKCIQSIDQQINSLTDYYGNVKGFSWITGLWLLLGYTMLILPYLLQSRHTKTIGTQWALFGLRKKGSAPQLEDEVLEPTQVSSEEGKEKNNYKEKNDYSAIKI